MVVGLNLISILSDDPCFENIVAGFRSQVAGPKT